MKIEIMNNIIVLNNEVIIYDNGEKYFYNNKGQYHNIDGSACEYISGGETWWCVDMRHRKYGPARKWKDSDKWWFEDVIYSQEEFMGRFL